MDFDIELFREADPVQDHILITGIEDGWIKVNDVTWQKYLLAKKRMKKCVELQQMIGYFNSYKEWVKPD